MLPRQRACTWEGGVWRGLRTGLCAQATEEQQLMRQVPSGEWVRDQHLVRATARRGALGAGGGLRRRPQ